MNNDNDFRTTFKQLKRLLQKHADNLTVVVNKPGNYSLNAGYSKEWAKEIFFGAVMIKRNYVSYHLMAVYSCPDLLKGISPTLKKRMQGKSCFNFTTIDAETLRELAALTDRGYQRFKKERWIGK